MSNEEQVGHSVDEGDGLLEHTGALALRRGEDVRAAAAGAHSEGLGNADQGCEGRPAAGPKRLGTDYYGRNH